MFEFALQVTEESKQLIGANPNQVFVVHHFNAMASGKVSCCIELVKSFYIKTGFLYKDWFSI